MEDKKMDAYLSARKPATLTIQMKNLPESSKKVDIKCTLVQFGTGFQATKYAKTDAAGMAKLVLDGNLPYHEFIAEFPKYSWAVKNETMSEFYGNLCTSYWCDVMPDKLFAEVSNHKPYFTSNNGVLFYELKDGLERS